MFLHNCKEKTTLLFFRHVKNDPQSEKWFFNHPQNASKPPIVHFFDNYKMSFVLIKCSCFSGDVKQSELSSSNEDIITALEALGNNRAQSRKSPRPTSVPFNKSQLLSKVIDFLPWYILVRYIEWVEFFYFEMQSQCGRNAVKIQS